MEDCAFISKSAGLSYIKHTQKMFLYKYDVEICDLMSQLQAETVKLKGTTAHLSFLTQSINVSDLSLVAC